MHFSASDAAFEGFRLTRRAPVAMLVWTLFYAVGIVAFFALAAGQVAALMKAAAVLESRPVTDISDLQPFMAIYGSMMAWMLPVSLLFGAVLSAAVARAVLEPGKTAFGYLRLGGDELRVLAVSLILGVVFGVGSAVVFGVIMSLFGYIQAAGLGALAILPILLFLAAIGGLIWAAVRLSLAIPITMAEKRIAPFASWGMTKGVFWPLLGMALLAGVLSILVSFLGGLVAAPVTMLAGAQVDWTTVLEGGFAEIIRAAWLPALIWVLINSLLSALQLAILYAPFSRAYLALRGGAVSAD